MKSKPKFTTDNGSLNGTLVKSKMGDHQLFRIANADLTKFTAKRYRAILTPLE